MTDWSVCSNLFCTPQPSLLLRALMECSPNAQYLKDLFCFVLPLPTKLISSGSAAEGLIVRLKNTSEEGKSHHGVLYSLGNQTTVPETLTMTVAFGCAEETNP